MADQARGPELRPDELAAVRALVQAAVDETYGGLSPPAPVAIGGDARSASWIACGASHGAPPRRRVNAGARRFYARHGWRAPREFLSERHAVPTTEIRTAQLGRSSASDDSVPARRVASS